MSGNSKALNTQIDALYPGGRIAILGIFSDDVLTHWNKVIFKGLTVKGIYGRKMFETWHKMMALLEMGLNIAPIITHRFSVDEYERAFELLSKGEAGKIVLHWN
jgi:threonine 3-dehydrogenase